MLIMYLTDGVDGGDKQRLGASVDALRQDENESMKAIGFGSGCDAANLQSIASQFSERGGYLAAIDGVQLVESFVATAAVLCHTGGRRSKV